MQRRSVRVACVAAFLVSAAAAMSVPGRGWGGGCGEPGPLGDSEFDRCGIWIAPNNFAEGDPDFVATMTTSRDRVVIRYEQDASPVEVVYRVEYWERVRR